MEDGRGENGLPLVIIDFHQAKSVDNVHQLLDNLATTRGKQKYVLAIWNSTGIDFETSLTSATRCQQVHTFISSKQFLSSKGEAIKVLQIWSPNCAVIIDGITSACLKDVEHMLEKFVEYESAMILCSRGLRLFPHKPVTSSKNFWTNGCYIQYYNNNHTDREVHLLLLQGGCCLFPTHVLIDTFTAMDAFYGTDTWDMTGDFHVSMLAQQKFSTHIWKVQMSLLGNDLLDLSNRVSEDSLTELDSFYNKMKTTEWPLGTFSPILPKDPVVSRCKRTIWNEGFHGLNMSAEPVHLDFEAARGYGASVVRFGAANDAKDLAFLINDIPDGNSKTDKVHLQAVTSRLQKAVRNAGNSGLKVILSLCDLPGRRFRDSSDDRVWQFEDYRQRIAELWGEIVSSLTDLNDVLIGYDIINEPFTSDDNDRSFDCPMSSSFIGELNDLYIRAVNAIRAVDKETMIIVESSFWSSPRTVPFLIPLDDPYIVYSFHFYAPNLYTYRHENHGQFTYPGKVPQWKKDPWVEEWPLWDKQKVREVIQPVIKWQKENGIPVSRIFVGEFGVCREVPGARKYLSDVMDIWNENSWSWCLFSFRDNEWDAMDYELGDVVTNQIERKQSDMMKMISEQLF